MATIFIDGYNLIFAASRIIRGYDISNPEAARDKLLDLLSHYKAVRPGRFVCFFDGGPEGSHLPRESLARGMEIIYSDTDSDADAEIKKEVSRHDAPQNLRVITSDLAIRNFVQRFGTKVTDSTEFVREIETALEAESVPPDEPIQKYEGGVEDDVDFWENVFTKHDEEEP